MTVAFLLTGCVSKLPTELLLSETPLTDENSTVEQDPGNRFSLRVPNGYSFYVDQEQDSARLFRIDTAAHSTRMFFEENRSDLDTTINLLAQNDAVTEVSREDIEINGLRGKKVLVILTAKPEQYTPYYFLEGGDYVYVFSLMAGAPFEHYLGIVKSFSLPSEQG